MANDGFATTQAAFTWYVGPTGGITISARPLEGSDDAEERLSGGVSRESTDLELIRDEEADQLVGIRFPNLAVPQGASILSAQIEFIVDERGSELTLRAEASDDTAAPIEVDKDISDRPLSEAEVTWSEPARDNIGALQPTPDLTSLVQEIVDRAAWSSGNAMAFIIAGSGQRTAISVDLNSDHEPRLVITYALT